MLPSAKSTPSKSMSKDTSGMIHTFTTGLFVHWEEIVVCGVFTFRRLEYEKGGQLFNLCNIYISPSSQE